MGNNDKAAPSKTTTTEPDKTTVDPAKAHTSAISANSAKAVEPAKAAIAPVTAEEASKTNLEAIKTASNTIESASATAKPGVESNKDVVTAGDYQKMEPPEGDARTKMDIATEVYKRMKKTKGVTRKEIIEQFIVEAKLSKAGASTYYQLIKARVK